MHEGERDRIVKNLNEKLASVLLDCHAKDDNGMKNVKGHQNPMQWKHKSRADAEFGALMARLDDIEKENALLKYELHVVEKELEMKNERWNTAVDQLIWLINNIWTAFSDIVQAESSLDSVHGDWPNALLLESELYIERRVKNLITVPEMRFMDDFEEMEKLALVAASGYNPTSDGEGHCEFSNTKQMNSIDLVAEGSLILHMTRIRVLCAERTILGVAWRRSIGILLTELKMLKESNEMMEDEVENQTQLTVAKAKVNEIFQKCSSLEVELEYKNNCCEELEATCLVLQLQLERKVKKRFSLRDRMLADDGDKGKGSKSPSNQGTLCVNEAASSLLPQSNNFKNTQASDLHLQTSETDLGSKNESGNVGAMGLARVSSKKQGVGFLRRLFLRRKKGYSKKTCHLTAEG
ncbi:Detected protein of unknown function [Hibiscus syriacus]|uniref:Uncharacterized protein n=1 Tax=Hibiscus syriacus TaxID=106335 RepID=A0A6A2WZQ1_HIBSY|nr:Detected protein of unknown function [Hibiscus syriacus]